MPGDREFGRRPRRGYIEPGNNPGGEEIQVLFAVTSIVNGPAQRQRKRLQIRHQALVNVPGQGRKNMVLSWRTRYRYGTHFLAQREMPLRTRTKLMWGHHVALELTARAFTLTCYANVPSSHVRSIDVD